MMNDPTAAWNQHWLHCSPHVTAESTQNAMQCKTDDHKKHSDSGMSPSNKQKQKNYSYRLLHSDLTFSCKPEILAFFLDNMYYMY